MMLPAGAAHPHAAETMTNYVYGPEVAARIAAVVNYIPPVSEIRAKLKPYPVLSPADEPTMLQATTKATGG